MTTQTDIVVSTVLVVLGIDAENKPHASKFAATDRAVVLRAAGLMAYRVLELGTDEVGKLNSSIPDGKVFATGKAFVPFVRRELYDQLAIKLGTDAEIAATAQPPATPAKAGSSQQVAKAPAKPDAPTLTPPWSEFAVGSTVLARDDENESWFEAVIVSIADDDPNVLRLRWRDYPGERQFAMHRGRVGAIGPGAR